MALGWRCLKSPFWIRIRIRIWIWIWFWIFCAVVFFHFCFIFQIFHLSKNSLETKMNSNPAEFFADANGDGLNVTWAHAVNSRKSLAAALNSNLMMIESDVICKSQISNGISTKIPFMAHPPATESDLSLEFWATELIKNGKKGMKADFKSQDAVDFGIPLLAAIKNQIQTPIFLNADILLGPNADAESLKIDAKKFLKICSQNFPEATLSLGWTTSTLNYSNFYTWAMVSEMANSPFSFEFASSNQKFLEN